MKIIKRNDIKLDIFTNTNFSNFFLFILFIYLACSINIVPYTHPLTEWSLKNIIKNIIGYSSYLVLLYCSIFLYKNFAKIYFNRANIFLLIYIFYILIQLPSLILSEEWIFSHGIYWIVVSISLPFLLICFNIYHNDSLEILFKLLFLILFFITIFFIARLFVSQLFTQSVSFSFYGAYSIDPNRTFLGLSVPRSSGMSRLCVVFFILFHQILLNFHIKKFVFRFILFLAVSFFLFLTMHFQSRISIAFILIYGLFNILPILHSDNFLFRLKNILALFIFALSLHLIYPIVNAKIKFDFLKIEKNDAFIHPGLLSTIDLIISDKSTERKKIVKTNDGNDEVVSALLYTSKDSIIGRMNSDFNSSGRINLWSKGLDLSKKNKLLGFGPLADRVYIHENISNLYLYSLISGGLLSLILISIFSFYIFAKCFQEVFLKLEFKTKGNFYKKISLYYVGYFFLRSIVENSYGIFGIDYFILLLSSNYLLRNHK